MSAKRNGCGATPPSGLPINGAPWSLSSGEKPIAILLAEGQSSQAGPRRSVGEGDRCSSQTNARTAPSTDQIQPSGLEGVRRRHEARRLDLLRDGWARSTSACWSTRRSTADDVRQFSRRFYREGARRASERFRGQRASGGAAFRDRRDGGRARDRAWPIAVAQGQLIEDALILSKAWLSDARGGAEPAEIEADDRASSPFHGGAQRKPGS